MRIILVTSNKLEHVYVANKLVTGVPLDGIVVDHGRRFGFFVEHSQVLSQIYSASDGFSCAHGVNDASLEG